VRIVNTMGITEVGSIGPVPGTVSVFDVDNGLGAHLLCFKALGWREATEDDYPQAEVVAEDEPAVGAKPAPVKAEAAPASNADIREWALAAGVEVSAKGRVSQATIDAYNDAH
jgi:hypothetical protein